jgi:hypothetical protein
MPKAQKPLTEEIIRGIVATKKGPAGWFHKLPADLQAELVAIREQLLAGKIDGTKTAVAKSIHAALSGRKLITSAYTEVLRWLNAG